jgi:hypothetical protein
MSVCLECKDECNEKCGTYNDRYHKCKDVPFGERQSLFDGYFQESVIHKGWDVKGKMSWFLILRREHAFEIEFCPFCGGKL